MQETPHQKVDFARKVFLRNGPERALVLRRDVPERVVPKSPVLLGGVLRVSESTFEYVVEAPAMKMGYLDRAPFRTAQFVEETPGGRRQTLVEGREQNLFTVYERSFREALRAMQCDDGLSRSADAAQPRRPRECPL